jgi:hypothetical protein
MSEQIVQLVLPGNSTLDKQSSDQNIEKIPLRIPDKHKEYEILALFRIIN